MNVHQLLSNGSRTDMIGPDLWIDTSVNVASKIWSKTMLGFQGRLYLGHRTNIVDSALVNYLMLKQ